MMIALCSGVVCECVVVVVTAEVGTLPSLLGARRAGGGGGGGGVQSIRVYRVSLRRYVIATLSLYHVRDAPAVYCIETKRSAEEARRRCRGGGLYGGATDLLQRYVILCFSLYSQTTVLYCTVRRSSL